MKGILFSQMEPPAELEGEFNDWYETEHIPVRLALPGFARAVRYVERDAVRKYLAVYEIDDLEVLKTPGYQALKTTPSARTELMLKRVHGFTRYTCTLAFDTGGGAARGSYLLADAHAVPGEHSANFDHWYEQEHIAALMRSADWLRVRRYKVFSADGGPWTDIALHELRALKALESPQGKAAMSGAGLEARHVGTSRRWLFEVLSAHEGAS